jgi:hypothetical protein
MLRDGSGCGRDLWRTRTGPFRVLLSHPFARRKANGWGTEIFDLWRVQRWSDAQVVGAPALDALLDLLAREVLFEGMFGQLDNFIVGGETKANQLVCC